MSSERERSKESGRAKWRDGDGKALRQRRGGESELSSKLTLKELVNVALECFEVVLLPGRFPGDVLGVRVEVVKTEASSGAARVSRRESA